VKDLDATVPADPQLKLLPERSNGAFNFWRVSFATWGGTRVYGYLSIPKDASASKKYPVRFQVPAAGNGRAHWTNNMQCAADAICMFIAVHPYEPPFDLDELEKLFKANVEALKEKYGTTSYAVAGMAKSREDYYFYRALLGINRAVNWLAARPEVDLSSFTYSGTSQGGGFGFLLLGLNHHFTKGVMYVPAITDTMGYLKGRRSGWPRVVESQREEDRAAAERNAAYFDGVNFASRIKSPIRFIVGFSDQTCPPADVYAAYNVCPSKNKAIVNAIGSPHGWSGWYSKNRGKPGWIDFDGWLRSK
jgi:cephalosporin-C deacetylase-like acetyl esterase